MKKTITEMYNEIISTYDLTDEHVEFLRDRLAKVTNKNSNSKGISEEMLADIEETKAFLATGRYTALEVAKHLGYETSQKATGILNKITRYNAKGELVRPESNILFKMEKGKKYFYIDSGAEEE